MNGNVLDLMKSYNAERRLRKAILFVHAMVRFRAGATKVAITKAASYASSDISADGVLSSDSLSSRGAPKEMIEREKKLSVSSTTDGRRVSLEPRPAQRKKSVKKPDTVRPSAQGNAKK
jgi:hypothetical protein